MKTFTVNAALAVLAAIAAPAVAQSISRDLAAGHYEWRSVPQYGPRASAPARLRIWVPRSTRQQAGCDCPMMGMNSADAAECMKDMHGMVSPSTNQAAS